MESRKGLVFVSLYLMYTLLVYVRRSFTYAVPAVVQSEGIDKGQLGLILSSQAVAYAVSKFISGILADVCDPRLLLSLGLGISGLSAVIFTVCESPLLFAVWWFVNGLAGGPVWPTCAVLLKSWFSAEQFGTAWSLLSTSMNVAGTVGPLLTAYIITLSGWRSSMVMGGLVAVVIAVLCVFTVQMKSSTHTAVPSSKTKTNKGDGVKSRLRLLSIPGFVGICLSYSVVSVVQYGTLQWGQLFLVQQRGQNLVTSSAFLSSLEIGGIIGSILAGYASDSLISKKFNKDRVTCRLFAVMWFKLVLTVSLYLFIYTISADSTKMWISFIGFCIGFGVYGPISIYGVIAIESAPETMSGTSHSIAALFANGGYMLSGLPLSYVAKIWDWDSVFILQLSLIVANCGYLFYRTYLRNKYI